MDRNTPAPELLIYLFMYVCQSPQKAALLQNWEKHKVTVHGTLRRWKAWRVIGSQLLPFFMTLVVTFSAATECFDDSVVVFLSLVLWSEMQQV